MIHQKKLSILLSCSCSNFYILNQVKERLEDFKVNSVSKMFSEIRNTLYQQNFIEHTLNLSSHADAVTGKRVFHHR